MTGKSHVITGIATATAVCCTHIMIHSNTDSVLYEAVETATDFLFDAKFSMGIYIPLCIFLYMIGTILPDIDTPYSFIGKIVYLPFKHRTWTHCWAPILLCCIGGIWFRFLFFLGFGIVVHMFFDSFSKSGVDWLYPIKFKHVCRIYHTGELTEYLFVFIICAVSIIYSLFVLNCAYSFISF